MIVKNLLTSAGPAVVTLRCLVGGVSDLEQSWLLWCHWNWRWPGDVTGLCAMGESCSPRWG